MANEQMYATHGFETIIRRGGDQLSDSDFITATLGVGGNTALVGDFVTFASENEGVVDLAATGDLHFAGIIVEKVNNRSDSDTLDTAITDGSIVKILKPTGGRVEVACFRQEGTTTEATAAALERGRKLALGTAGKVRGYIYVDGAEATDTLAEVVGRLAEDTAANQGDAADDVVVIIDY